MGRNSRQTPEMQIPRLIRLAFSHAKKGEEEMARRHWNMAIEWGYEKDQEAEHSFEMAVKAGLREHGLVPPIMLRRRKD